MGYSLSMRQQPEISVTYTVHPVPQYKRVRLLATTEVTGYRYDVVGPRGLYARVDSADDAAVIAYGLNSGFVQHALGGFSDDVAAQIRTAMEGRS